MSAVALLDVGPTSRPLPVPVVLALQESRRIVLHPIALVGALLTVVVVLAEGDGGPREAFETVTAGPTFFYGVFVYFAAHLVASRDRRSGSGELLAPVPSPRTARVAGLCLAALAPALLATVFVVLVDAEYERRSLYLVDPTVWHLAQAPLTVLGAALLGTMVARLTAVPGVALLVMVTMVLVDAWLDGHRDTFGLLATYALWTEYAGPGVWAGMRSGSAPWHVAYLVSLCAMAGAGAFLREGRRSTVLAVGALCTAAAVVTGLLQLP